MQKIEIADHKDLNRDPAIQNNSLQEDEIGVGSAAKNGHSSKRYARQPIYNKENDARYEEIAEWCMPEVVISHA